MIIKSVTGQHQKKRHNQPPLISGSVDVYLEIVAAALSLEDQAKDDQKLGSLQGERVHYDSLSIAKSFCAQLEQSIEELQPTAGSQPITISSNNLECDNFCISTPDDFPDTQITTEESSLRWLGFSVFFQLFSDMDGPDLVEELHTTIRTTIHAELSKVCSATYDGGSQFTVQTVGLRFNGEIEIVDTGYPLVPIEELQLVTYDKYADIPDLAYTRVDRLQDELRFGGGIREPISLVEN